MKLTIFNLFEYLTPEKWIPSSLELIEAQFLLLVPSESLSSYSAEIGPDSMWYGMNGSTD